MHLSSSQIARKKHPQYGRHIPVPTVYQILGKAKLLKDAEGYNRVFICPDRTVEERIGRQKLVTELKEKRSADPNKHFIIRKGEVVCLSERTGCVDNV